MTTIIKIVFFLLFTLSFVSGNLKVMHFFVNRREVDSTNGQKNSLYISGIGTIRKTDPQQETQLFHSLLTKAVKKHQQVSQALSMAMPDPNLVEAVPISAQTYKTLQGAFVQTTVFAFSENSFSWLQSF